MITIKVKENKMLLPYNSNKLYFFVTRGIPGCGKSNFTHDHMSKISIIVESDVIREKLNGISKQGNKEYINQENGAAVWDKVYNEIHNLLFHGYSVTLDATNISKWQLDKYKTIAEKYNAEYIVIDFSHISLKEAKIRNSLRKPEYKRVPDFVIERMYRDIIKQNCYLHTYKALHDKDEILSWLQNII